MYVKKRMSLLLFAALAMVLFTACGRWDFSREAAKAANEAQGETLRVEFTVEQKFTNALRAALEENIQPADVEKAMRADESIEPFLTSGYRLDVYPLRADISAKDAAKQLAAEFVNRLAGCEDKGYISMVKADNGYFYEAVLTYKHSSSGSSSGGDDATTPTYTVTVDAGDGGTVITPESDTITTGSTFEFTVTPEEGFKVSTVTASNGIAKEIDKEKRTWELSGVTENTTITVEFAQQTYAVTIKVDPENCAIVKYGHDIFAASQTFESIAHGSSITFSVQASEGYEIVSVSSEEKGELTPTVIESFDPQYTLSDIASDDTITVSVQTKE